MEKEAIEELELLLEFVPPKQLMKRLNMVFCSYLINNKNNYPSDLHLIVEDLYFLIRFLEKMDEVQEKRELKSSQPR